MSTTGVIVSRVAEMVAIVGREHVCDEADALRQASIDGVVPGMLISPASAEEVAAVLRTANQHALTVVPVGGGTRIGMGQVPEAVDIALSTTRLNAVESYDPGDLTICLEAGVRVADVQRLVLSSRQQLPLDVAMAEQATIGGVLASGDFGPLKHGFGGAREFCIGVKFVTGDGRPGKGGGRVVKNVAGYDMMKLLIGSYGTLGVITSANFKLFPLPRRTRTFAAGFDSLQEAVAFRNSVIRSPLTALSLEIVSPRAHEYLGFEPGERWSVLLRAGGSDAVLERYRRDLGSAVGRQFEGEKELVLWDAVRNFSERVLGRHANAMTMEIHVPQSEVSGALAAADRVALEENFLFAAIGRCAVASMLFAFLPIAVDPPSAMQYVNAVSALRAELPHDGAAIVTRCPLEVKGHVSTWGRAATDVSALRAVKHALDPNNILSRGRLVF